MRGYAQRILAVSTMISVGLLSIACSSSDDTLAPADAPQGDVGANVPTSQSDAVESSADEAGDTTASPLSAQPEKDGASILTNYFAQAEQGGYWDVQYNQWAKDQGVTIDVTPGGPGINTIPQVAAGSYDFGVGQADDILLARSNGLPVVVVAGAVDETLFVIMTHASEGINSFADLNGHHVAVRTGALYWGYLKEAFGLDDVTEVNFAGSMAEFKLQTDLNQQGYSTSDVQRAIDAGVDVKVLSVAQDGGYNPYAQVLFTTEDMIRDNPILVKAVVQAVLKGWENFIENPSDAKEAVMKSNPDMESEIYDMSAKTMIENRGEFFTDPPGQMTAERWNELKDQLVAINVIPDDFDVDQVWTDEFMGG